MFGLEERGEAAVRYLRAIGLWRLAIGFAGLVASYGMLGLLLSGRPWTTLNSYGTVLVFYLPLFGCLLSSDRLAGVSTIRARKNAFAHFSFAVIALFTLWGLDWTAVARPRAAQDFGHLAYPLLGLLLSSLVLSATSPQEDGGNPATA